MGLGAVLGLFGSHDEADAVGLLHRLQKTPTMGLEVVPVFYDRHVSGVVEVVVGSRVSLFRLPCSFSWFSSCLSSLVRGSKLQQPLQQSPPRLAVAVN